jgi:hypothetical protein
MSQTNNHGLVIDTNLEVPKVDSESTSFVLNSPTVNSN